MTLTEADKKKIEEEETYRAEVRNKTPQRVVYVRKVKNPTTASVLVFFFGGFGWLYLGSWSKVGLYFLVQIILLIVIAVSQIGAVFLGVIAWHVINIWWASDSAKKLNEQKE